jgi:dipeptidyl aminopeptidase/acylaminoacyl peptidase
MTGSEAAGRVGQRTQTRRGRLVVTSAGVVALAAAGYVAASWVFSAEIVAFRVRTAQEVLLDNRLQGPASVGLPEPLPLAIPSDDVILSGWLFRHPDPAGCGVVLSHGHAATRHESLKFAPPLWARGCHLLLYDARHHGETGGRTFTWGIREREDLLHAVDALGASTGLPRDRIGLFGDSLGAAVSLQAAAIAPDVAFVVADSPFACLPTMLARRAVVGRGRWVLGVLPGALVAAAVRAGFDPRDACPLQAAAAIRVPVLLVHAREDAWIPPSDSEAIAARLRAPHRLAVTDWGAERARSVVADPERYAEIVHEFLAAEVPGFGRDPRRTTR